MTKTPAGGFNCTFAQEGRCYNQWRMKACCTSLCFGCLVIIEMKENCYSQIVKDWTFIHLKLLWNNFAAMDRSIQVEHSKSMKWLFVCSKSLSVAAHICISYICLAWKRKYLHIHANYWETFCVVTLLISFYNHV